MNVSRPQTDDPHQTLQALLRLPRSERAGWARSFITSDDELLGLVDEARRMVGDAAAASVDAMQALVEIADELASAGTRAGTRRAGVRSLAAVGRFDDAITLGSEAITIAEDAGERIEAARARIALMHPYSELGRLDRCTELGTTARAMLADAGAMHLAARADINLGIAWHRRDEPARALEHFDRARPHVADEPAMLAAIDNSRGEVLVALNRFDEAAAAFTAAREGFTATGQTLDAAIADGNLADVAYRQGVLHEALAAFERARRRLTGPGLDVHRARILAEEAEARTVVGFSDLALDRYAESLPILDRMGVALEAARARRGMGITLLAAGRDSEASTALAAAAQSFDELGHRTARALTDVARASLALRHEQLDEAQRLAGHALATLHDRPADVAIARRLLADVAVARGDEALADAELQAGLAAAAALDLAPLLADLHQAVGRLRLRQGRADEAIAAFDAASDALERIRGALQARRFRIVFQDEHASVYDDRYAAIVAAGGPDAAARAFAALEHGRSRSLLEEISEHEAIAAEPRTTVDAAEASASVSEVASAPASASAGATASPDGTRGARSPRGAHADAHADPNTDAHAHANDTERDRLERTRRHCLATLNALYSRLGDTTLTRGATAAMADWRAAVRHHETMLRETEARLDAISEAPTAYAAPVELATLQSRLDPGTLVVGYAPAGPALTAVSVRHDGTHLHTDLAPLAAVTDRLRRLRFQIDRALRPGATEGPRAGRLLDDARDSARALHDAIFAPIAAANPDASRLVVVPCGILHLAPFAALHDDDGWLAERIEVVRVPSVSIYDRVSQRGPGAARACTVIGFGDADAPEIEREARALADAWPSGETGRDADVRCRIGPDATVAAALDAMDGASVVHLACHGRFDDDHPGGSGLRLADRWLSPRDLIGRHLDAELVTLSGCETGLARADAAGELDGLARALIAAGARRVVASLWRVDDRSTLETMTALHHTLHGSAARSGAPDAVTAGTARTARTSGTSGTVSAALARVRRTLMQHRPHPAHWAAFTLIGGA